MQDLQIVIHLDFDEKSICKHGKDTFHAKSQLTPTLLLFVFGLNHMVEIIIKSKEKNSEKRSST